MSTAPGIVSAFTEDQTARLTGISVRRLRAWDRSGLFSPELGEADRRGPFARIYSFRDVAALRVLATLTETHKISLHHLREVAARLCALDPHAWTRTTLYVLHRKVVFTDPEHGGQREIVSGQYAFPIVLERVASDARRDIKSLSRRGPEQQGVITRHRHVAGNRPVIAGTRIPVAAIQDFARAGYSMAAIAREYPGLSEDDIRAAIDFRRLDAA